MRQLRGLSRLATLAVVFLLRGGQKCGENPVYNYSLSFGGDGIFDPTPNATFFRQQFLNAGFTEAEMIEEGRLVTKYLQSEYGVDLTHLPGEVYLAPNIALPGGVTFTYVTISPELNFNLITASRGKQSQFVNAPVSAVWYAMNLSENYKSTGSFNGIIPAGSTVVIGNYFIKACAESILGGDVFIRFVCLPTRLYMPGGGANPFQPFDCVLEHKVWGLGKLRGLFVFTDLKTSTASGREILTFP